MTWIDRETLTEIETTGVDLVDMEGVVVNGEVVEAAVGVSAVGVIDEWRITVGKSDLEMLCICTFQRRYPFGIWSYRSGGVSQTTE